jgi:hypothetical protein
MLHDVVRESRYIMDMNIQVVDVRTLLWFWRLLIVATYGRVPRTLTTTPTKI